METLIETVENLVHLNMIMKADCPIKIETPAAHDWLVNFLVEFAENQVKNCIIPDVMQRSELLLAFANALNEECGFPLNSEGFEEYIKEFLSKQ